MQDIPVLSPHILKTMNALELPFDSPSLELAAQFTCRVGAFHERIKIQKLDDGEWHAALRVRRFDAKNEIVKEIIPPEFPKDIVQQTDW